MLHLPLFHAMLVEMSPRSPVAGATKIEATSSPGWNLLSSKGALSSLQIISAAFVRRRAALVHELGLAVDQLDVGITTARFRIALASRFGSFLFVVAGVVEVLIIGLTDIAGADRLHVPDVAELALVRQILVAKRFASLAGMAGHHAALLAEVFDRVADVPD